MRGTAAGKIRSNVASVDLLAADLVGEREDVERRKEERCGRGSTQPDHTRTAAAETGCHEPMTMACLTTTSICEHGLLYPLVWVPPAASSQSSASFQCNGRVGRGAGNCRET